MPDCVSVSRSLLLPWVISSRVTALSVLNSASSPRACMSSSTLILPRAAGCMRNCIFHWPRSICAIKRCAATRPIWSATCWNCWERWSAWAWALPALLPPAASAVLTDAPAGAPAPAWVERSLGLDSPVSLVGASRSASKPAGKSSVTVSVAAGRSLEAGPEASRAAQVVSLPVPDICARRLVISGAGMASVSRTASCGAMAGAGSAASTAATSALPTQAFVCMGSRLDCTAVAVKAVATGATGGGSIAAGGGLSATRGATGASADLTATKFGGVAETVGGESVSGAGTGCKPGSMDAGTVDAGTFWGTASTSTWSCTP